MEERSQGEMRYEIDFWNWVLTRRVTDTPRGDFVSDTKDLVAVHGKGRVTEAVVEKLEWRLHGACREAQIEEKKLRKAFAKTRKP